MFWCSIYNKLIYWIFLLVCYIYFYILLVFENVLVRIIFGVIYVYVFVVFIRVVVIIFLVSLKFVIFNIFLKLLFLILFRSKIEKKRIKNEYSIFVKFL